MSFLKNICCSCMSRPQVRSSSEQASKPVTISVRSKSLQQVKSLIDLMQSIGESKDIATEGVFRESGPNTEHRSSVSHYRRNSNSSGFEHKFESDNILVRASALKELSKPIFTSDQVNKLAQLDLNKDKFLGEILKNKKTILYNAITLAIKVEFQKDHNNMSFNALVRGWLGTEDAIIGTVEDLQKLSAEQLLEAVGKRERVFKNLIDLLEHAKKSSQFSKFETIGDVQSIDIALLD
ncbi:hypothetical protein DID75_03585 [Candidatus Marinamargulisbacteria bacterium SCGC AG-410-N11]|nr:hypothetical protein DID75_03585 [Candidatus Marinamargulisbacteria bacterium SCGC AG-410-N11]